MIFYRYAYIVRTFEKSLSQSKSIHQPQQGVLSSDKARSTRRLLNWHALIEAQSDFDAGINADEFYAVEAARI